MLRCPACKNKIKAPVLHLHHQQSLLQKIKAHFNEVRGQLMTKIDKLYEIVQHKLAHSDDLAKDREIYINNARFWFQTLTPECLYFGRFISENNDVVVHEMMTKTPKKRKVEPQGNEDGMKKNKYGKLADQSTHAPSTVQPIQNGEASTKAYTYGNATTVTESTYVPLTYNEPSKANSNTDEFDLAEFFMNC